MTPPVDRDRRGFLTKVTPVILTFNEAPNIGRVLDRLTTFGEVLVVDSGSDDGTLEIVARYPNTRTVSRTFDSFSGQWNFATTECGLGTEWALAMDADYVLPDEFLDELSRLSPADDVGGYRVSFTYCIFGKALSATLYPPVVALLRHRQAHYVQEGHCMRAQVKGSVGALQARVLHDDRKPLARWLSSQARYADEEAELLLSSPSGSLRVQDRIRRMIVVAPWLVPMHFLVARGGISDGWRGILLRHAAGTGGGHPCAEAAGAAIHEGTKVKRRQLGSGPGGVLAKAAPPVHEHEVSLPRPVVTGAPRHGGDVVKVEACLVEEAHQRRDRRFVGLREEGHLHQDDLHLRKCRLRALQRLELPALEVELEQGVVVGAEARSEEAIQRDHLHLGCRTGRLLWGDVRTGRHLSRDDLEPQFLLFARTQRGGVQEKQRLPGQRLEEGQAGGLRFDQVNFGIKPEEATREAREIPRVRPHR